MMQKRLMTALLLGGIGCAQLMAGVKYVPEQIIEGSKGQKIVYDPAGTKLENETNIRCVVYVLNDYWWEAKDVAVSQQEGKWIGSFDVPENVALLCAKFYAKANGAAAAEVKTDWGWPATYASFVLDKQQKNKEGACIGWGMLRTRDSGLNLPGMMEDSTAAPIEPRVQVMWFNNEYRTYPQAQPATMRYLVPTLNRLQPGLNSDKIRENINFYLTDKSQQLSDQAVTDMYDIARRSLNDSVLTAKAMARAKELYPDGILARAEELLRIQNLFGSVKTREANDPTSAQAQKDFVEFLKRFPSAKFWDAHSFTTDLFYDKIFRAVIYDRIMRADDYSNLGKYIHDIPFLEMVSTHWHVCEIPFTNGQISAEKALPHSEMIINEILSRPRQTHQMKLISPAEWDDYVTEKFQMAFYAHARILNAVGRRAEAMKFMERVFPYYGKTAEYADLYVKLLQQLGRQSEVIPYIKKCVPIDATTQDMLDVLKADFLRQQPQGNFDTYMASLKNSDKQAQDRAKAIGELIDVPVELCELDKMGGGRVNLAAKQGKIVFLDFWATWCAPCKASMPGGQMTVDRWKNDKDVEFYFVDTQEMKGDYRQKAADFIKQKGFTFNVLYDEGPVGKQDKLYKAVAGVLHTSGIPLKVILDKRGHIRWMGSGYHGSPTQMADEISYILEYLKNEK